MTGNSGLFENTKGAKVNDYKERMKEEYRFVKDKYNKLHKMIVKYEAGTLEFEPDCPLGILRDQKMSMGEYLYCLEIRAEIEGVEL